MKYIKTLYHGSYTKIIKPEIIEGKYTKDFGPGFYCTAYEEQAKKWSLRYDTPILNIYNYNENDKLSIKEFDTMTEEWFLEMEKNIIMI